MKVTPKTSGVRTTLYDHDNTVAIDYSPNSWDPVARVVEFPKVWREGGKQYTTYRCTYYHNGDYDDKVTVRVPDGASCYAHSCDDTVEEY